MYSNPLKAIIELKYVQMSVSCNTAYNISFDGKDQPMFKETMGVSGQNGRQKNAVWQNS